jgi:5'-deoxynucleotidase YfbR-like HD superfamily hydrolase
MVEDVLYEVLHRQDHRDRRMRSDGEKAMTRDEVTQLAKEVGAEISAYINYHYDEAVVVFYKDQLERFAALVAEREREACAKVCEDIPLPQNPTALTHIPTLERCAAAIRARGESK